MSDTRNSPIADLFSPAVLDSAAALLRERRLWKLRLSPPWIDGVSDDSDHVTASAMVLADGPEPMAVSWDSEEAAFRCECGRSDCLHGAALILKVARNRPGDGRFAGLSVESESVRLRPDAGQGELFDLDNPAPVPSRRSGTAVAPAERVIEAPTGASEPPGASGPTGHTAPTGAYEPTGESVPTVPPETLNPESDLLFFTEPSHLEKRAVTVFGPRNAVAAAFRNPSDPGSAATGSGSDARFRDMRGGEWMLCPALVSVRKDGDYGPPRPWSDEGLPEPVLPGRDEIRESLAEAIGTGDTFISPVGRPWTFRSAASLRFRFDALLSANEDDPLFEPVAELICPGGTGAGNVGDTVVSGAAVIAGKGLLILDGENAIAAHLEDLEDSLWFVRLMLSRRVLSASDLKARLTGRRRAPENILIDLPDLPDSLEVLNPTLVLEVTSRDNGTDLVPRWKYGRVIIDGRGKGDVVMDASLFRPKPVGLRDRRAEETVLDAAEEILGPALAWRRGRYARLSGDPNIPLRLDAPLQDVLAEFGGALMEAGVELRLENRPIRRGGGLNIRAARNGSALEMSASVEPAPEDPNGMDEAAELELDSWLDQGGLVRTGAGYFTLTGRALDQLNFLRDHGMEDSGFLSTSPDNLSLIDAVYSEIEADEAISEDLEKRREAYIRLTSGDSGEPDRYVPPPEVFGASLRPYQQQGYSWLMRLRDEGLGGCLADDMGLGKTVQTLAYLSRLDADGKLGCSLLVGPVVTLGNWTAEIDRFAPTLRVHRYAGPAEKRFLPPEDAGVRIIVVSYQTLRNDIERFLERDWDHIILDEAHYVKNAASRTFKAIRSLRAAHRISLTGTPIENHLDDLWSQMNFLNPGLLGSRSHFTDRFVKPSEDGEAAGEKSAASRLGDIVAPFILRRRKSEVLTDLPPKDEAIIRCEMTTEQAGAYDSMRRLYGRQVQGLLSTEGLNRARVEIFTIISKLRLLAIHPPLAGEPFAGIESGKMAAMDRLLEDILDEDHKTLVFSQFLGALDRAEATCREHGWAFSRLTGSTKDREEPIRRFNEDEERRVFLLSLKAGGVGINLTAADYVMLLDPWWNPAVEAQAVDRAHRMGQQRPVMVYRLITTDTIEDRVLDLQKRKKDLIAGVLGDDPAPPLSEEEILNLFE